MSCTWVDEHLDDGLDGALPADEARRLAAHLEDCADCRRISEELRSLRRRAAALPKVLEPRRDLWPEIEARLPSPRVREGRWRRWSTSNRLERWAAVLIFALAGFALLRQGSSPAASGTDFEAVLLGARQELLEERMVLAQASSLPLNRSLVDEQLEVLEEAIRQIRRALDEDPGNPRLEQALIASYRKQLELLQIALRLSPAPRDLPGAELQRRQKNERV